MDFLTYSLFQLFKKIVPNTTETFKEQGCYFVETLENLYFQSYVYT